MERDRTLIDRPASFALIVGGVKGAVAGLVLAAIPVGLEAFRGGLSVDLALGALGAALALAVYCGLDACSARLERGGALVRLLGGALVPAAAAAPQFGILQVGSLHLGGEDMTVFAVFAGALGLGLVVAGAPDTRAHKPQSARRLYKASLATMLAFALVAAIMTRDASFFGCYGLGLVLAAFAVTACVWTAQLLGSLVAAPVANWLEPGSLDAPEHVRGLAQRELSLAMFALRAARRATNPERALAQRHEAREAIVRAEALLEKAAFALPPGEVALRKAEVLLALDRLDEAALLVGSTNGDRELEAEIARRRGDAERAVAAADSWLHEVEGDDSARAHQARGNAWALIALARKDQGRLEEARASLDLARSVSAFFPRTFEQWSVEAVASELLSGNDRGGPPGPPRSPSSSSDPVSTPPRDGLS